MKGKSENKNAHREKKGKNETKPNPELSKTTLTKGPKIRILSL